MLLNKADPMAGPQTLLNTMHSCGVYARAIYEGFQAVGLTDCANLVWAAGSISVQSRITVHAKNQFLTKLNNLVDLFIRHVLQLR